jgi:hypothetical protein
MEQKAAATQPMPSEAEQGRDSAQALWRHGLNSGPIEDPLTAEFARGALAELERLQHGTPGIYKQVLEGAQMSAEQLNVESFHGLIEIVQNADDLRASEVRVAIRESGKYRHLLIVHNGERVQLPHVIAMTFAFVSTKRDDPRAKGRFGIGLKTLGRLGDLLTIHSSPYDFTIRDNHVEATKPAKPIPWFYDPTSTDTFFELHLRESFDSTEFKTWFESLGPESLVFLDTVRSLRFVEIGRRKTLIQHCLKEVAANTLELPGINEPCEQTILKVPRSKRSWARYEIERKMPLKLRRRYKAREDKTPIAVVLPTEEELGQIYAGLPLGISTHLPFSPNAQFDVDVARRGIQHEPLNKWLFKSLSELTASVALHLLKDDPPEAWRAIPLKKEQAFSADDWIAERIA